MRTCSSVWVETPTMRFWADDAACVFGREIALADVDAVEVGEDGEVCAVVQDELAVAAGECFAQDCGRRGGPPAASRFYRDIAAG